MAENLAYAPSSGNYWAYDNDDANIEIYGYLYDWQTALNVCPTGWHMPSDGEWKELTDYLGGQRVAGGKLKATGSIEEGTGLWYAPNTGATNESGFTALPGGIRSHYIGLVGGWWSATEYDSGNAWFRDMICDDSVVRRGGIKRENGLSVRCLKD
jgi:uncharacterized protein (TIGR02145 family)